MASSRPTPSSCRPRARDDRPVSLKRGGAAIVGAAESDLGQVADGLNPIDLMAQGIARAAEDAGLRLRDIDGLLCATTQSRTSGLNLSEYLGISPRFIDTTILGGSSFMFHVAHAVAALQLGLCEVAAIAYGSTQRSVGRRQASVREINPFETPYRPFLPSTAYALAASRHMHEFGTTREQMAEVAVAARQWALLNPVAWEKKPLTVDEVLECAHGQLPVHGARHLPRHRWRRRDHPDDAGARPLTEEAAGLCARLRPGDHPRQHFEHARSDRHRRARKRAKRPMRWPGSAAKDIDVVELYDAFTINTILFLEDLGFCAKGEGGSLRIGRAHRARRRLAGQHQWRRPLLLPSRHVRPVPADRGGAAIARRMRRRARCRTPKPRSRTAMAASSPRKAPSSSAPKQPFRFHSETVRQ